MGDSTAPLDQFECVQLVQEGRSRVLIRREVIGDFDALDERPKARLLAIATMWCDPTRVLTIEQFNGNETRAQKGPINRMLCAFKARRVRLYGFVRRLKGYRTFVIVDWAIIYLS